MKDVQANSGFAELGNARLYYELAGGGPPLIMLHAGVADNRQWNREFAHFAQDFRVLRYDLRGYGRSRPVEGEFSHLGDLTGLLDRLIFLDSLVLMGCSMGGTLAMDFTLENSSRVNGLIMIGSGPSGLVLDVSNHPKEAEAEKAYWAGELDRVAELEAQIWFDGSGRSPEEVDPEARRLVIEMTRTALSHDAKKLGNRTPDTAIPAVDRLDEIQVPVLVLVGENDIAYSQASADYMVEHIPTARKVMLPDAAHLANLDHPGLFQRTLQRFLNEIFE